MKSKYNLINFSNDKNKFFLKNNLSSNDFINEKSYKLLNQEKANNYIDNTSKNKNKKILSNKLTQRILRYNFKIKELQNKIYNYTKNEKEKNTKKNKPFMKEIFIDNNINNFSFSDKLKTDENPINQKNRLYNLNKVIDSSKKNFRKVWSANPLYSNNLIIQLQQKILI